MPSVIRVGRLAVVEGEIIVGAIGQVAPERLRHQESLGRVAYGVTASAAWRLMRHPLE